MEAFKLGLGMVGSMHGSDTVLSNNRLEHKGRSLPNNSRSRAKPEVYYYSAVINTECSNLYICLLFILLVYLLV